MQQVATVTSTGASVTYDNGVFAIGGETVGIDKVMEYDHLGIIGWVNDETKAWAYQLAQAVPAAPQPAAPQAPAPLDADVVQPTGKPKKPLYKKWWVWVLGLLVLGMINNAMGGGTTTTPAAAPSTNTAAPAEQPAPAEAAPVEEPAAQEPAEPALTMGQQQAAGKGQSYLDVAGFSRKGLIEQLVYEDFSKADATCAVDYLAPDWNAEAAEKAQSYIDVMSFSRSGLIEQLVYEGFTQAQAKHGAKAVGY